MHRAEIKREELKYYSVSERNSLSIFQKAFKPYPLKGLEKDNAYMIDLSRSDRNA